MDEDKTIELDRVLLIADDDNKVTAGNPLVEGARIVATSQGNGKGKKIIIFKYKPKTRYRKKTGHRQLYTRLSIDRIIEPGATEEKPPAKKTRRKKKEVTADGA